VDAGEGGAAAPPVTAGETAHREHDEDQSGCADPRPLQDKDTAGEGVFGCLGNAVGNLFDGVALLLNFGPEC